MIHFHERKFGHGVTLLTRSLITAHMVYAGKTACGDGATSFHLTHSRTGMKKSYLVGSKCIVKADITIIGSTNDA
jgi:hypothetical protein